MHRGARSSASVSQNRIRVPVELSPASAGDASDHTSKIAAPAANDAAAAFFVRQPIGGALKRAFDIIVAGGLIVAIAPVLVIIALLIKIESRGPVFFKQQRGGVGLRPFVIWKFRTMRWEGANIAVRQATLGDKRVTLFGQFLRKSSLDEFPQLINVLLGDMSLVGPRPHALTHDRQFTEIDPRYPLRSQARPGITGLAQVSGSRGPTLDSDAVVRRTSFDITYVRDWSFWLDLKIMARTALLVIKDDNAF